MRILDPIHKYIVFSDEEAQIVDSAIFQRLRYIRQLGFAEFAFPGAVHNRFLHSLGVFHVAGCMFDALFTHYAPFSQKKKQQFRQALCLAALLHDVGHGPLSHISEKAMPRLSDLNLPFLKHKPQPKPSQSKTQNSIMRASHEHYTLKFLLESDLNPLIANLGIDPLCVVHLMEPDVPPEPQDFFVSEGINFQPILKQIISSDVDADRIDYLQRDSFFCGVDYGFCGHDWILKNLHIYINDNKAFLAIGEKAIYSVESFLLGRRHMGLALYFHNKMVAMDEMLYHYFASPDCCFHIPSNIKEYMHCTDDALFEHLKMASKNGNPWAHRIIKKQPFKRSYELNYPYTKRAEFKEKLKKVQNWLKQKNVFFIPVSSTSYVNYDLPELVDSKDFQWRRGRHDKPYNEQQTNPVYIINETSGKAMPFYERMRAFNKQEYIHLVDRIYLSPEDDQKFRQTIQKL